MINRIQPNNSISFCRMPSSGDFRKLTGTLAPTLNNDGWILRTKEGSYLLTNIKKFINPQNNQEITIEGNRLKNMVTSIMQGTPFEITNIYK